MEMWEVTVWAGCGSPAESSCVQLCDATLSLHCCQQGKPGVQPGTIRLF